jgi:cellulose synthase/poly-beta-1,6-N-acetylglucosamine synthase-like glycosyltransferase/peptidoglycan/xylan/chitin deacetylase (PgdA/CDA1 family)/spore germination protein YaaH
LSSGTFPIFYDSKGRRWRRVRGAWFTVLVLSTLLAGVFIISVIVNPILPTLNLRPAPSLPQAADTRLQLPPLVVTRKEQQSLRAQTALRREIARTKVVPAGRPSQIKVTAPVNAPASTNPAGNRSQGVPLSIGFYVNWDDSSYSSLKRNLQQLDWVVPEWVRLGDGNANQGDTLVSDIDPKALDLIRRERPQMPILPLVQNYKDEQWNSGLLARAVGDEPSRQRLVDALSRLVDENRFGGVTIDLEEVPSASQANLLLFMTELHAAFHERGFLVAQAVPFDNPDWNYSEYAAVTDYLMLMGYDEHWQTSQQGSIAGQNWFEQTLAKRMRELDPAKTILCVGSYGYNWTDGVREADEVTFQEAVLAARDSEAIIQFDPKTRNPHFTYDEEDGTHHTVWFLDAVTAFNEIHAASSYHPAGYALWRLGSEDPSLWQVFGSQTAAAGPEALRQIHYGYDIDFEGAGEILQVTAEPQDGVREVSADANNFVTAENYTQIPSSYVITRAGDHPGLVALTFDDGPDPEWTPRILDVLKREGVPASFFIIGENGQANPELVRRIVREGHDIGNHTFTHPNLGEIPTRVTALELNATQRLIESLTGRSTMLFRPPYFGDAEPTTPEEVEPIVTAKHLGYITVGLHVDPDDWAQPGAQEVVNRTIAGVTDKSETDDQRGQIVLLHDGGGDRAQTVEALPQLIEQLKARGFKFVTVSELAGLQQAETMPPVTEREGLMPDADSVFFSVLSTGGWILHWLFIVGIVLGAARLVFIGALALAQKVRARKRKAIGAGAAFDPFVSVIIPAYMEERVIAKTIRSLLASDYQNYEIIIVDDGSSDRTSEVVRDEFSAEARVRLFTIENSGKAEALGFGLRHAKGEVIIGLDADTLFDSQTILALARRFADPTTGAVAGNAKVGNRINTVTRWQALEYITAQNLDRRAFASLNCITVVPGAVGAWRRDLLERAGGFSPDTLAEDQDLTLRVRKLGYKIGYEETAIAWTEAPDTLKGLSKQRFRWSFGTLQCMWKHKGALLNARYGSLGFIAMPNVWVFQIIFPLISPVMDLMMLWALVSAVINRLEHGAEYNSSNLKQVLFYYALFLLVDWLAAAFAFLLEKREQWSLLWWLFLQRFGYRQVMYKVMVKSVVAAGRGALVGWGKLERKATAEVPS